MLKNLQNLMDKKNYFNALHELQNHQPINMLQEENKKDKAKLNCSI